MSISYDEVQDLIHELLLRAGEEEFSAEEALEILSNKLDELETEDLRN